MKLKIDVRIAFKILTSIILSNTRSIPLKESKLSFYFQATDHKSISYDGPSLIK